jgi:eukaryotic-like serine/threonine-protein kinase
MALSNVGPYRILERLGAGANGEVWLAEDTRLHRRVALKTLTGTAGSDAADQRRRMLREARAAARLNHPRIAGVYDVLESDEGVHIVMEYVRGATLATRIRQGPPPPMQVMDLALQLAGALAHAHSFGVIHRDLKPANVVLTPEGGAKILDFGLARLHEVDAGSVPLSASEHSVDVRHTVGTPPYIPPEHLHGAPVDARGDIYSLGVTLFELLTGRRPFEAGNGRGLSEAILTAPTPRPRTLCPDVPAGLDAIVYRAMSRNPADRYPSAAEMEADLKRLSAGITDAPTQSRPWPLIGGRGDRRLGWSAAALVAVALGTWAAVGGRPGAGAAATTTAPVPSGPKVVAVLPLAGASGDPQMESLAAGVADSLITTLSQVPGLTVVSRAATLKYQDRKLDPDEIADELGANMLVDGLVQRSGESLRISLNLREPGAKTVRWQNTYDGTFAEVFSLQRGVAEAVAGALSLQKAPAGAVAEAPPTSNVEAYADYAQARTFLERQDVKDNLDRSIALFQSAIRKDPRFARAHGGLGEAYWRKYQLTRDAKASTLARDALADALRLKPDDVAVRYSLASIYRGMGRHADAVEELREITRRQPQADDAHRLLGQALIDIDQLEAGLAAIRTAIGLRPQYWAHHFVLGSSLYAAGRYPEALPAFQRVVELQPDSAWGYQMLGTTYHALEDTANAKPNYLSAIRHGNATARGNLGILYFDAGQYAEALPQFEEAAKSEPGSFLAQHNLGDVLTQLGRKREGIAAYTRAASLCKEELEVSPRDAETLSMLALLEAKLGRHAEAARNIASALALDPGNADALYAAAVVHALGNRPGEAIAALEAAVKGGYSRARAARDPSLAALKGDPRYAGALGAGATGGGT